jgi:hypothetical protein
MKKYVRVNSINSLTKAKARYQPYWFQPEPWPKPNNPWDNIEPSRLNQNVIDEYEKYLNIFFNVELIDLFNQAQVHQ